MFSIDFNPINETCEKCMKKLPIEQLSLLPIKRGMDFICNNCYEKNKNLKIIKIEALVAQNNELVIKEEYFFSEMMPLTIN